MLDRKRRGFTLIELLVVVAIIAVLVGILLPSLSKARESAKRATCQANLRSIGQAVRGYMDENSGYYPPMAPMKESEATEPPPHRLMMSEILKLHVGNQGQVFQCPCDYIIGDPGGGYSPPSGITTWFGWQGSSYEPMAGLSLNSNGAWDVSREDRFLLKIKDEMKGILGHNVDIEDLTKIAIVHDYQAFHGNMRNALYGDFHVAPLSGQ